VEVIAGAEECTIDVNDVTLESPVAVTQITLPYPRCRGLEINGARGWEKWGYRSHLWLGRNRDAFSGVLGKGPDGAGVEEKPRG
jgi:hypothetical protein